MFTLRDSDGYTYAVGTTLGNVIHNAKCKLSATYGGALVSVSVRGNNVTLKCVTNKFSIQVITLDVVEYAEVR